MTRRLIREGDPPAGQLASPVPQYWNPNTEAFEDVLGAHGAPRAILYDGLNGQPISQSNPLEVRVRELEAELAAMRGMLETGNAKVTLSGSIVETVALGLRQQWLPRGIYSSDQVVDILVPPGARGVQVALRYHGFTGQFAPGEGCALRVEVTSALGGSATFDNRYAHILGDRRQHTSGCTVHEVSPEEIDLGDAVLENWAREFKRAKLRLVGGLTMRISALINGTFQEGEGFDIQGWLYWKF